MPSVRYLEPRKILTTFLEPPVARREGPEPQSRQTSQQLESEKRDRRRSGAPQPGTVLLVCILRPASSAGLECGTDGRLYTRHSDPWRVQSVIWPVYLT